MVTENVKLLLFSDIILFLQFFAFSGFSLLNCKMQSKSAQKQSGKSESDGERPAAAADSAVDSSFRSARLDQLKNVFIDNLQYDSAAFAKKPAEKLKKFGSVLCKELGMTFQQFVAMAEAEREAACAVSYYPPPEGAARFFEDTQQVIPAHATFA